MCAILACETLYVPYHSVQPFAKQNNNMYLYIFLFICFFCSNLSAYLNDIQENKCHNSSKLQHILNNLTLPSNIIVLKAFKKVAQYLILKVSTWISDIR